MNKTAQAFKELFSRARKQFDYFLEGAIIGFTEDMVIRMKELKLTKADLAKKLDCKPSYITKVFRGSTNFTLSSMVKIGIALDSELEVRLRAKTVNEDWSGILQAEPKPVQNFCWQHSRQRIQYFQPKIYSKLLNHEHGKSTKLPISSPDSARELFFY